ncbi:glycosyltransferase family A protein [Jeongeupia wiesaeckerbachi]
MPKISVIVPVYNLEFYISRCLNSLARQLFKDFEVIVVNDGSKDDSQLIVDEFVLKYPDVFRSYIKENGGHGSACNVGLAHAKGDYIVFVDGDDFLDPDALGYLYQKIEIVDADMLIGNLMYHFSDSITPFVALPFGKECMLDEAAKDELYNNWATPCGRIYKAELFANLDFRFKEGIFFADANFAPKSYLLAKKIYYVNKEVYNYDITRPTQSMKQTDRRILNIIPALRDMLEFYKSRNEFDANRKRLETYTVRHCVSWIAKVKTLHGYSKLKAIREIFSVLDDYFPKTWEHSQAISSIISPPLARLLVISKRLQYFPLALYWDGPPVLRKIDRILYCVFELPLRSYLWIKRVFKRLVKKIISMEF